MMIELLLALLLVALVGAVFFVKSQKKTVAHSSEKGPASLTVAPHESAERPSMILLGETADKPLVTIKAVNNNTTATGRTLDLGSPSISRMSALLQAAPSILVAAEASGKQLMEVVVNGDLVRASDGNGVRAFTMGANGIKEHARLFEVKNLSTMINAAAIWQIASVVVAQKHLADISEKLDQIKEGVKSISSFLDNERRSRIEAAQSYLTQAFQTLQAGEMPASIRGQLESCERDLLEIQIHLTKEYRQSLTEAVEHREKFGTETLAQEIAEKIVKQQKIAQDLALCLQTRIIAWHVLALYPGEPHLKDVRRANIQSAIDSLQALGPEFSTAIEREIAAITAVFNRAKTLEERRDGLRSKSRSAVSKLTSDYEQADKGIKDSSRLLQLHDAPARFLFEYDNRELIGVRELAA